MAKDYDFIADLGTTISRTVKKLGRKTDDFIETQKIRSRILMEQKTIERTMTDMGKVIYRKYADGEAIDEGLMEMCESIMKHKVQITKYREALSDRKERAADVEPAPGQEETSVHETAEEETVSEEGASPVEESSASIEDTDHAEFQESIEETPGE